MKFLILIFFLIPVSLKAKKRLFVSTYPLESITKTLLKNQKNIEVWNPVEGNFWIPNRKVIEKIKNSDLIIINGANNEKWVSLFSLPRKKIVNTSKNLKRDLLINRRSIIHSHGEQTHSHSGHDGNTWVSPRMFLKQVSFLYKRLIRKDWINQGNLRKEFLVIKKNLQGLDKRFNDVMQGNNVLANHSYYNYLQKDYGVKIKSFNFNPSIELNLSDQLKIAKFLEKNPTNQIWWSSRPLKKNIQLLKRKFGLKSIVFKPLHKRSEKNYFTVMKENLERAL